MIKLKKLIFEGMSEYDAEQVFSKYGIPDASKLPKDVLKKSYISLVNAFHPDKATPELKNEMDIKMRWINSAFDVLKKSTTTSNPQNYYHREEPADYEERMKQRKQRFNDYMKHKQSSDQKSGKSDWSQAGWSGGMPYSSDGSDRPGDLNYYKKKAWEISGKPPTTKEYEYTFCPFDGTYFRAGFSVYAIQSKLFEISQMVQEWEKYHKFIAIFYRKIDSTAYLINLRGKEVNPPKEFEDFDTNDSLFIKYLSKNL